MRKFLVIAIVTIALAFSGNAFATGKKCPPGQEKKGWKCVDIEQPDDGGTTINNEVDIDLEVKNTNIVTNLVNSEGGDADARAKADAKALAIQGQTANNEGVVQSIEINEARSFNHIVADVGKTDAELLTHDSTSMIRTLSSFLNRELDDDDFVTYEEAKLASKGADIEVVESLKFVPKLDGKAIRLDTVNYIDFTGKHMGSLTLTTEDATLDQMEARAALEAMEAGATSFAIRYDDAMKVSSSKYGIDLGSSASIALNPDTGSAVVAPGATLGWSKAVVHNKIVTDVYVILFFDSLLIISE